MTECQSDIDTKVGLDDGLPLEYGSIPYHGFRVVVVGNSGSGKTTLAGQLAHRFGVPHVEFDAIRHGPNWVETPDDTFREILADALSGDSWVADGNYSIARDLVWPRATSLIWLDYPFGVIL